MFRAEQEHWPAPDRQLRRQQQKVMIMTIQFSRQGMASDSDGCSRRQVELRAETSEGARRGDGCARSTMTHSTFKSSIQRRSESATDTRVNVPIAMATWNDAHVR